MQKLGDQSDDSAPAAAIKLIASRTPTTEGFFRTGARLCNRPGIGLSPYILKAQRKIEDTIQKPLIASLIAGDLSQRDYHKALHPTRKVYEPINRQLLAEYELNIDGILRLRDLAEKNLWPSLHGEWLPRLEADPSFLPKFKALLRDALLQARFDPLLKFLTKCTFELANLIPVVGRPTRIILNEIHDRRREETKPFALFFQEAAKKEPCKKK